MKKIFLICLLILFVALPANAVVRYAALEAAGDEDGTSWANAWAYTAIGWTSLDDEESTLYLDGGTSGVTYTSTISVLHDTAASRLYIRPGSASPAPTDHDGQVTITTAGYGIQIGRDSAPTGIARYVTIDGETTIGSGTRNIRITAGAHRGIEYRYTAGTQVANQFRYLEIDNNRIGETWNGADGIKIVGDNALVEYCYIHENYGDGVNFGTSANDYGLLTVRYNSIIANLDDCLQGNGGLTLHDNTLQGGTSTHSDPSIHPDGYQGTGPYNKIYNNSFTGTDQAVFLSPTYPNVVSHLLVYNNTFVDSATDEFTTNGVVIGGDAGGDLTFDDILIANNTFYLLPDPAIRILGYSGRTLTLTNVIVENNLIYDCGNSVVIKSDVGTTVSYALADVVVDYNIIYSTAMIQYDATDDTNGYEWGTLAAFASGTGYTHNTESQPLLTDPDNGDFTLQSGDTVAIDAGVDLSSYFTTDKSGTTRSGTWDIGAYEYQGGGEPPAPGGPSSFTGGGSGRVTGGGSSSILGSP